MSFRRILPVFLLCLFYNVAQAQLVCPPNIDFELGDLSGWSFFTGSYDAPATVPDATVPGPAIPCRHTLTKVTGLIGCTGPGGVGPLDQYGGFPVIAPGGGSYSLRVGNNVTGGSTEKARFYIHIPPGSDNYSLIYRYAVCFEDPGPSHTPIEKPQFIVAVFDSAATAMSGGAVPVLVGDTACSYFKYTAGGILPGFSTNSTCGTCSPTSTPTNPVQYKSWTTSTVDLSGLAGTTVGIDFISSDCRPHGHFGYGYVDMSCGLFKISAAICDTSVPPVLSAPDGFAAYTWYDSATFTVLYGTGMTITIPFPPSPVTIAVILTPYPGYGCPDTLYTRISPSALSIHPSEDTAICRGRSITLQSNATDIIGPLYYSWSPAAGLSCTNCASPVASPTVATSYTVTVTNPNGCTQQHVYNIGIRADLITNITSDTPSCHGYTNGWATVHATTGKPPFNYEWSTSPVQVDSTAIGLPGDTFTVVVIDSFGCTDTNSVIIKDPAPRVISIDTFFHPTTCLGTNGSIVLEGDLQHDTTYTISYTFGGVPLTRVAVADALNKLTLTGLGAGTYSNITIIGALCNYNVVGPVTLTDPPIPDLSGVTSNSFVCVGDTLKLFASSTTTGVAFLWEGPAGFTSGLPNPVLAPASMAMAGTYSVTVSKANCYNYATTVVDIRPLPVPVLKSNTPVCSNDTLKLQGSSATGATTYIWNGPNFFNSYTQSPNVAHVQTVSTGVYTLAVNWNGCTVRDTMTVVVNQTPMAPVVHDTNYCQHDIAVPYDALGTSLTWFTTPTGGVGFSVAPVPSTTQAGKFTVYVSQTSAEGCTSERSPVTARVWLYPQIRLSVTDSVACAGKNITYNVDNVEEGNTGFAWQFGSGVDDMRDKNPINHSFTSPGVYTVSAAAYYQYCPTITMKRVISVFPYATFDLGPDTTICPGNKSIMLSARDLNTYGYPASWKWATGETTPKIVIVAPGTYRATVNINGCETSDTVLVANDCYISVPNVFTPNGDGVNDFFFPRQLLSAGMTRFDMSIYNRWGQLLFQSNTLEGRGWDGTFKGVPQPEGVYIYTIDAAFKDGQQEQHKGNVTLMR